MSPSPRRAVITGLGVLTPIGSTPAALRDALAAGASGVRRLATFDPAGLACQIAGQIPDFDPKALIDKGYRKSLNVMSRMVQLGVIAAQLAVRDAGVTKGGIDPERFGVSFAALMAESDTDDLGGTGAACSRGVGQPVDMEAWGRAGVPHLPPTWMLKYLPNMPACHVTIMHDARGPSNSVTTGDTAGAAALGEALRAIRRGAADLMLVGGAESRLNPLTGTRLDVFAPLVRGHTAPDRAVRPFDRAACGTCPGEAGAAFALEELAHARRRGATILGEVLSASSGVDRDRGGTGFARVIRSALAGAGITPADVDHVNAHGTGVPELDVFEARGIGEVFGREVRVFAPLSRFGNTGAASGIVELACSLLALQTGELPGTLNHTHPAEGCPIRVHTGPPRPVAKPYAVKTSYTDMGQCAAMVVKRWDDA